MVGRFLFALCLLSAACGGSLALLRFGGGTKTNAALVLTAVALSYALTPLVRWTAHWMGAIDRPNGRKVHETPTPLLGGAAIYAAFIVTVVASGAMKSAISLLLAMGSVVFLTGVIEDSKGVPAVVRLIIQIACVGVLIHGGTVITFMPPTWWGIAAEWFLTGLWIVGITNAFNFLDGLDGLATGSAAIHALFMGIYASTAEQTDLAVLSLCLMGACLGFLPHNYKAHRRSASADIFLGDSGSTFLGFMLASLAVMGDWAEGSPKDLIVPVLILAVPIFDMVLTTVVRIADGSVTSFVEWILYTGRDHFHHRLIGIGMRKKEAVAVILLLNLCLGLSAFLLKGTATSAAFLVLAQVAIVFGIVGYALVIIDRRTRARAPGSNRNGVVAGSNGG